MGPRVQGPLPQAVYSAAFSNHFKVKKMTALMAFSYGFLALQMIAVSGYLIRYHLTQSNTSVLP